ncbi:phospho-sugar mutase, partial [Treponema pallidum]
FGTAGLRGVVGGGTNRMNPFMIKKITHAIALYLLKTFPEKAARGALRAVIAYDSRVHSRLFAHTAAHVFLAHDITAYLFSDPRPTPELSYAVQYLTCDVGIVVTASHNPPQYNGYKVYWNDGAQIAHPHEKNITEEMNAITSVVNLEEKVPVKRSAPTIIDAEIDEPYCTSIKEKLFRPGLTKETVQSMRIAYTPLHGTGALHVERILGDMGFSIMTVPEQRLPDGNFPTVSSPNPEDPAALVHACAYADRVHAEVLMATDPDADRFACAVRNTRGVLQLLTGNQMGALFTDYILLTLQEQNNMPARPAIVRSVVTSPLSDRIARTYGATCVECLTGFKWICGTAEKISQSGAYSYVYGFEESYGHNFGIQVRDKDGINAAALCAEMGVYWKLRGMSLIDRLHQLFRTHGLFCEKTLNKTYAGVAGVSTMNAIMNTLRRQPLTQIARKRVMKVRDIYLGVEFSPENPAQTSALSFPQSNVLQYFVQDGSIVSIRPSGTEQKIKCYIIHPLTVSTSIEEAEQAGNMFITAVEQEMGTYLQ